MAEIICPICGIAFGVPQAWLTAREHNKEAFYCPNGHGSSYRESDADKVRQERDHLRKRLTSMEVDHREHVATNEKTIARLNREIKRLTTETAKRKR